MKRLRLLGLAAPVAALVFLLLSLFASGASGGSDNIKYQWDIVNLDFATSTLSQGGHASAFATTVNYSVSGTATEGGDYTGTTTHSITIAAGDLTGTITVDPTADTTFENDETVVVTLTGGSIFAAANFQAG